MIREQAFHPSSSSKTSLHAQGLALSDNILLFYSNMEWVSLTDEYEDIIHMSRFHFVISSSVFAVQDVISKKAVKKSQTKYQSLARQGGKRKMCWILLHTSRCKPACHLFILLPFLSSCFVQRQSISGVKPELGPTILGEIYLESPCEMTFGPILLLNSSLLLSRCSSSFLPFTDIIRCCRWRKPRT